MSEIAGPDVDVLVIGAGPVGLALACHLRRLDLSVEMVEARAAASEHSKAIGLAWTLARVCRGAPDMLLDTYGEERLPHAAEVLRETNRTTVVDWTIKR